MRLADMLAFLSEPFAVGLAGEERGELRLAEVIDHGSAGPYEQYSVKFQGDARRFHPQAIYEFSRDSLGTRNWMLVPIGMNEEGYVYEAVFSVKKSESFN